MGKSTDYKVDKKEEYRVITKAGDVQIMYRIWATSKGGTYYHVELLEGELDKAEERLSAKAKQLDAIQ